MNKSVEIIICPVCGGEGVKSEPLGNYLDTVESWCERCAGSGRLIKTLTIEAFSMERLKVVHGHKPPPPLVQDIPSITIRR